MVESIGKQGGNEEREAILAHWRVLDSLFRAHPWHGVSIGEDAPRVVTVYVEMLSTDVVKYELDKVSGYLKVDRPQQYSSHCPTLYGFVPQTYCGKRVGEKSSVAADGKDVVGDGDPLDICVFAERPIQDRDLLLRAVPIGGLKMLDGGAADDKIIGVLKDDSVHGCWADISDIPDKLLERLKHYFLTYKEMPGGPKQQMQLLSVYGREEAYTLIEASRQDYVETFSEISKLYHALRE